MLTPRRNKKKNPNHSKTQSSSQQGVETVLQGAQGEVGPDLARGEAKGCAARGAVLPRRYLRCPCWSLVPHGNTCWGCWCAWLQLTALLCELKPWALQREERLRGKQQLPGHPSLVSTFNNEKISLCTPAFHSFLFSHSNPQKSQLVFFQLQARIFQCKLQVL